MLTTMLAPGKKILVRITGPDAFAQAKSIIRLAPLDWRAHHPLARRMRAWRRGFYADSYALYDLPRNNASDYVSDFMREYRCAFLNTSRSYFAHKLTFRAILLHAGVKQPETVALATRGNVLLYPFSGEERYLDEEGFERFLLDDGGRFIVKPEAGSRGESVFLLDAGAGALMRQRGRTREPYRMSDMPHVAVVERMIQQGPFWSELCPDSANSIRVLTGWAPGDPRPIILRAVQRMGTAQTVPTDNWSGGGICAVVDLASGRLGPGRVNPLKSTYPNRPFDAHPDTGARIEGAMLPHWDRIQDTVMRACLSSPLHRYVGWDVLVDDTGEPVVLEGNANSDVDLLQVHGGLLTDPEVRRFYQRCGVV